MFLRQSTSIPTTVPTAAAGPAWPWRLAILLLMAVASGGCAINADENEVVIEYFSDYPGVARYMAENHCAEYGKTASLVQIEPEKTYPLGFRKKRSVYKCVGKAGAGQTGPAGPKVTK